MNPDCSVVDRNELAGREADGCAIDLHSHGHLLPSVQRVVRVGTSRKGRADE